MLGIFKDLSNDDYHADTSAVSRSGLWEFKKCPAKYWNTYLNPERPIKKQTPDMMLGSAFHTFVLEPHLFEEQYAVHNVELPPIDELPLKRDLQATFGKDVGAAMYEDAKHKIAMQKDARDRILANHAAKCANKTVLTKEQYQTLELMRNSVMAHPEARELIHGGAVEHSLFWEDPHTGIRLKTRPDVWHDNMTVDLKTTVSADERSFISSVVKYGYHWQSAFNREGIYHTGGNDVKKHAFVCVEKEWPYLVAVYILDQSALDSAHTMIKNTLRKFKDCKEKNEWPSYQTQEISLPAWAD